MRERFVLEEVRHNANATMLAYVSWHRWIAKKKCVWDKECAFCFKTVQYVHFKLKEIGFFAGQDEKDENCILITRHDSQEKNKTMQFLIHLLIKIHKS